MTALSIRDQLSARDGRRKLKNQFMRGLLFLMAVIAIAPLISVFAYVVQQGFPAMSWSFFTHPPAPIGETGGGMANAMLGTLILISLASVAGIPIGISAGLFLSEYGRGKLASILRFSIDLLSGIPSIIIGLFAYAVLVMPMHRFSAYAGGAALAVLMIPTVARTTEELLRLVPGHIREAGLALGIPRWKVILFVVLRGSLGGISTGVILGVARAAGETAPLLFTALSSSYWPKGLDQPIASLPVQIYTYAISPYEEWHQQAWAGAFILVMFVFLMNLTSRVVIRRQPAGKD
jgi:phosphate transport system permease protein